MLRQWQSVSTSIVLIALTFLLVGCGSAQKMVPHMGFGALTIETQIGRDDIVVLDRVEGSSTLTSILFGTVQIIDGDKVQLLGIKFFKDKYTYWDQSQGLFAQCVNRAYYKALEAAPDADAVFHKSLDHEDGGAPLLWETKAVTVKGKAVKLKSDP
jgi:hypothetical protein